MGNHRSLDLVEVLKSLLIRERHQENDERNLVLARVVARRPKRGGRPTLLSLAKTELSEYAAEKLESSVTCSMTVSALSEVPTHPRGGEHVNVQTRDSPSVWTLTFTDGVWVCSCPYYQRVLITCKHQVAALKDPRQALNCTHPRWKVPTVAPERSVFVRHVAPDEASEAEIEEDDAGDHKDAGDAAVQQQNNVDLDMDEPEHDMDGVHEDNDATTTTHRLMDRTPAWLSSRQSRYSTLEKSLHAFSQRVLQL